MNTYSLLADYYEFYSDYSVYKHYLKLIKAHTLPCKVLEVGCGTAYLSRQLTKEGYKATALDNNLEMLTFASHYAYLENVEIALFNHDMLNPPGLLFELIIMPFDVVNHTNNLTDAQKMIFSATKSLKPKGVLIFDFLHQHYLESIIGHKEPLNAKASTITWIVERGPYPNSVKHTIQRDDEEASHVSCAYDKESLLIATTNMDLLEEIITKERTIIALRKKEI